MSSHPEYFTDARFGTAINCMDGRCQDPVNFWLKSRHGVQFIDVITEPGIVKILSGDDEDAIAEIRRQLTISVNRHGSRVAAVAGHHNCAGDPLPREEQYAQIEQSARRIASWGLGIRISGLYVNDLWRAEHVCDVEG